MFEGKPPFAPEARVWKHGEAVEDSLCPVDWDELKARLAAARDLRSEWSDAVVCEDASFDADSARRLAASPVAGSATAWTPTGSRWRA